MEKNTAERLVAAALGILGESGSGAVTVRGVEEAAGVPHGSVRHHFGGVAGLWAAAVDALLAAEGVAPDTAELPTIEELVARWTGEGAPIATARYEVMLMATRDDGLQHVFLGARDALVARVAAAGTTSAHAEALVAMLDGLVLDALLRRRPPDLTLWKAALVVARNS